MGWSNQVVNLIVVTVTTTGQSGIFGYSPNVGAGNLLFSLTAAAGTDPYGNSYPAGLNFQFTDRSQVVEFAGNFALNIDGSIFNLGGTWITFRPQTVGGVTWQPGVIGTVYNLGGTNGGSLLLASPYNTSDAADKPSYIELDSKGTAADRQMTISSGLIDITADTTIQVLASGIDLSASGQINLLGSNVQIGSSPSPSPVLNGLPMYISGTGIPGFTWHTAPAFLNDFKNRAIAGFPNAEYYVDAFGQVTLHGLITGGAASAIGSAVLNMPAGLRPSVTETFAVSSNNGAEVYGRVDVEAGGNVVWRGPTVVTAGVNWFSLTGIKYYAIQ